MSRTGWQRTWVRGLTTGLVLAMMTVIFLFSTEDAEKSDQTSGVISQAVIRTVYPDYDEMAPDRQTSIFNDVQHFVRKTAHFTEYLILGLLMRFCAESWFPEKRWTIPGSFLAGAAYAVSDEMHQRLIDGRSGQGLDVALDSCGVLTGVLFGWGIICFLRKRTGNHEKTD